MKIRRRDVMNSKSNKHEEPTLFAKLDSIIEEALMAGARQLLFCPMSDGRLEVKHRNGQISRPIECVPSRLARELVCRIKMASNLSIDIRGQTQGGEGETFREIRVNETMRIHKYKVTITPCSFGEEAIIEFLN